MKPGANWKNVPLPPEMIHMDFDKRGYPIPYIVNRRADGTPDFVVNDTRKVVECIERGLCAISGLPLEDDVWFVGGHMSAYHPAGAFKDPPVRHACAVYAMQVCPFLAAPSYAGMKDTHKERVLSDLAKEGIATEDPTVIPGKPEFFVIAKCNGYLPTTNGDPNLGDIIIHPNRPWLAAEHWQDGVKLSTPSPADIIRSMHSYMTMAIEEGMRASQLPSFKHLLNTGRGAGQFPWNLKS